MAGRIPQSFIDELLTRLDVVDVVDSRVKLKKAGKNYSACCPFHNENTPSFTVSRDKQFYYCFGCGATGSALKFVMEFDGLPFPDAVEKLADSVSMTVPREHNPVAERAQLEHAPLYDLLQQSADFYSQTLRQHQDRDRAVQYLKGRGLTGQAARFFNIGFAPPGWDNLQTALVSDERSKKHLISNGMLIERDDGRTYDRFRDRIMFPIRDIKGRTIAFGGRVLGDEKPKYLNSPETPVFQKNRELYGLYEARKIRQKLTRLLIVEGYMDVVALAQYGIHYAVATLGTATSEHHLHRLYRMVPEVVFCFDGDEAGKNAAARAMETVLPVLEDGRQARFLFLPDGEDPDSLVQKEGKDAFEQRLASASHLPEFLFAHLKQQVDFDSLDGKARLDQLAAPLISRIPQGTLKDLMVAELENQLGITSRALEKLENESIPDSQLMPEHYPDQPPAEPIVADTLTHYQTTDTATAIGNIVEKAIRGIVLNPQIADNITIPKVFPETEREAFLFDLIRSLHQSPQSASIGLHILWSGTDQQSEILKIVQSDPFHGKIKAGAADVQEAMNLIKMRELEAEGQELVKKFASNIRLTEEEKRRMKEIQLEKSKLNKSRFRRSSHK